MEKNEPWGDRDSISSSGTYTFQSNANMHAYIVWLPQHWRAIALCLAFAVCAYWFWQIRSNRYQTVFIKYLIHWQSTMIQIQALGAMPVESAHQSVGEHTDTHSYTHMPRSSVLNTWIEAIPQCWHCYFVFELIYGNNMYLQFTLTWFFIFNIRMIYLFYRSAYLFSPFFESITKIVIVDISNNVPSILHTQIA